MLVSGDTTSTWIRAHDAALIQLLVDLIRFDTTCVEPARCVSRASGMAASLSAIVYVAHLGQAKSDAGTGFELMAITAVVLGGTSIFGGRGTVLD